MILLIIFVCGILGILTSTQRNMLKSLQSLFCQSVAVYGAFLSAGYVIDYVPDLPLPYGSAIRAAVVMLVLYGFILVFMCKLVATVIRENPMEIIELPIPRIANLIFSKTANFLTGYVFSCLLAVIIAWGAFSFKLPGLCEPEFRDSVRAHVAFFVGTMNVFTWSCSYAPVQKKQLQKLFPEEVSKEATKDKLSSLSEEEIKNLAKKTEKKKKKKKKRTKRVPNTKDNAAPGGENPGKTSDSKEKTKAPKTAGNTVLPGTYRFRSAFVSVWGAGMEGVRS